MTDLNLSYLSLSVHHHTPSPVRIRSPLDLCHFFGAVIKQKGAEILLPITFHSPLRRLNHLLFFGTVMSTKNEKQPRFNSPSRWEINKEWKESPNIISRISDERLQKALGLPVQANITFKMRYRVRCKFKNKYLPNSDVTKQLLFLPQRII